jgi:hypothetical protein
MSPKDAGKSKFVSFRITVDKAAGKLHLIFPCVPSWRYILCMTAGRTECRMRVHAVQQQQQQQQAGAGRQLLS